jgi:N-acetylmuramoyl-L-alanine amidase
MIESKGFHRKLEIDVLARTVWGEARGEGRAGMEAVACVVMNRARIAQEKDGYWWGNSAIQICQKPYQFSCWNKDDANFRKVLAADENDPNFALAEGIAALALAGNLADTTCGATHYHAAGATPGWAYREKPVAVIGRHIFYRMEI